MSGGAAKGDWSQIQAASLGAAVIKDQTLSPKKMKKTL